MHSDGHLLDLLQLFIIISLEIRGQARHSTLAHLLPIQENQFDFIATRAHCSACHPAAPPAPFKQNIPTSHTIGCLLLWNYTIATAQLYTYLFNAIPPGLVLQHDGLLLSTNTDYNYDNESGHFICTFDLKARRKGCGTSAPFLFSILSPYIFIAFPCHAIKQSP